MRKLIRHLSPFLLALVITMTGLPSLPVVQSDGRMTGVSAAFADDDDGGDDDGGDDGGGGRGGHGGGRGGDGRDDDDGFRPRGDLRSLFRWPFRRAERPPQRQQVSIPDRAPDEIVAIGLTDVSIAGLTQDGFVVDDRRPMALTGGELVRLTIPRGMSLAAARQVVTEAQPGAAVDFNHFYQPDQQDMAQTPSSGEAPVCSGGGCTLLRHIVGWPALAEGTVCTAPVPIGLIDTAINAEHPSLAHAEIEIVRLGETADTASGEQHGTAVAALLVGATGSRAPGLLPSAKLVAVDAFQRYRKRADIADIHDLVIALDMLVSRRIKVVNLSLSGPANLLLERAVGAAIAKGTILVAAAGNKGPNAPPLYPAAYPDVIAVTAIDRQMKPYRRAVRGDHIDIAAPGVGVWTAASISGGRQKSGTSFAAPFVTAAASLLAGADPKLTPKDVAEELARQASDMGEPGKDAVFGWGVLNVRSLCQS